MLMDPFRYHDSQELEQTMSHSVPVATQPQMLIMTSSHPTHTMYSKSAPVLSLPLVLPETPGEVNEVCSSTSHHIIETQTLCASPGVHVITTVMQKRSCSNPRPIISSNICGSSGGQISDSTPAYDCSRWKNMKDYNFVSTSSEFPSSLASSPPDSISDKPLSFSSSPPTSVFENGLRRRSYSRSSSVSDQFSNNDGMKPCSFCKKNGERPILYRMHQLKAITPDGRQVVSCPILRSVRCSICGATGDHAHTLTHCPYSQNRVPIALMLKNTARRGDGSLRKRP